MREGSVVMRLMESPRLVCVCVWLATQAVATSVKQADGAAAKKAAQLPLG